jgi:hypothetical protein
MGTRVVGISFAGYDCVCVAFFHLFDVCLCGLVMMLTEEGECWLLRRWLLCEYGKGRGKGKERGESIRGKEMYEVMGV